MIQEEDVSSPRTFLDVIQVNDEYFIMCANGKVYKLHNIDEQQMNELVVNIDGDNTAELNETILKSAVLDKIVNIRLSKKIEAFCYVQTYEGDLFIVSGAEGVYFITRNHIERKDYPENTKMIKKIFNLDNFIIGLTDSGDFVEICPFTRTMSSFQWSNEEDIQLIADLRVLESNDEYIELLVLTEPRDNERSMKILDFPSMKCKSELTVPNLSWLVTQQKSSVNMYFISGTKNSSDFIQTIEFKSISETDPEERYKKLLLRGHFDEAEAFAKQFDLSLEPLHEARVKKAIMKIQCVKPSSSSFEKVFKALMTLLATIENKKFLVALRRIEIPDRSSMTTFLEYLLENIDTNQYQEETNEINELLLRLETLRLIDPDECNMLWQKFLHNTDMARVAMNHFKSDVLLSCLVWSRHSSSIMPNLNLKQFHKWLNNIPTTVEPFSLVQWLKHFSPCFLQLYPNEMTMLVEWSLERTRGLQFSNAWPEIGLEFINNIYAIFNDVKFMFVDIRRSYHNNMEKMQKLIFTLEEMSVLKKTYHLTMTLDDYSKGSIEDTSFRLLQRIPIQNFQRMVNDFLYPIFQEHGSSPEETIVKYIQFLCTNKNLGYWQERAVMAIELLHNEENRLNSALLVLKVSPVPWSDIVLPLAMLGSTSSHPLANTIYIEYKTQSIKIIKVKYQWPVDYFDLQQDRVKLVFRILKVNNADMIDDVKTLVNSSPDMAQEAYFYLIHRLVELGKLDELSELLAYIEEKLDTASRSLFEKTMNGLVRMIDDGDVVDGEETDTLEAVKFLLKRLKSSLDDHMMKHYEEQTKNLRNIIKLRRIFQFDVKLASMKTKASRKRALEKGISLIVVEAREKTSIDQIWSKMELLLGAFSNDRIFGYKLLSQKLNNLFITCRVVEVLSNSIDDVKKDEVESALELVVLMIAQQIGYFENNLAMTFHHYDPLSFPLAYQFLIKCLVNHNLLYNESILELLIWMRIGRNYYPFDVIEETKKERVIDSSMFGSKVPNGHQVNGDRRESFSIFEAVEEKKQVKQVRIKNES